MTDRWLLADSIWWGPGTLGGPAGLLLRDGVPVGGPVAVADVPDEHVAVPGTLLPGLVDAHVHSMLVDLAAVRAGGIAAVWDLGGVPEDVAALQSADPAGADLPVVTMVGPFLTAPGGYPSDRAWAAPGSWREVRSADDAADAVAECRVVGATMIKLVAHAGGPQLPGSAMRAAVEAAHAADLPVVVHAEGPGTVAAAHEAGADLLAHTPWTERLDDGLVRAVATRMTWISTLDIHGWGTPTPDSETALVNLRRFLHHGGRIRYGTDLGNGPLPVGVNPREISALLAAGLTPEDVLTAMTDVWSPVPPCRVEAGLDLDPAYVVDALASARVVPVTP